MHLLFYRSRPDVHAICHAHPPTATGFAAAGRALEAPVLPEIIVGLGKIPLASYGTPGTWEVCAGLEPLVQNHDAILLENHGVVTCGPDLETAFQHMETVEQFAKVMLTAELLGGPHLLPRAEVQKLVAAKRRSVSSRPAESFALPRTAEDCTRSAHHCEPRTRTSRRVMDFQGPRRRGTYRTVVRQARSLPGSKLEAYSKYERDNDYED